ncbi:MAG: phosphate ABC transporter substrate-binding protein PstS [Gammaproteobacteria bacterium]|nr:phosphate ABC transporter substrate-binding protein PstS [Gammaproteobacteria bacterium]
MKMKAIVKSLLILSSLSVSISFAGQIIGAGSSFIYPVLSQWTQTYATQAGTQINYQPIGSGGGLRQLQSHTVDFAASDMPMTEQQLAQNNWLQFPVLVGGIVPIVNIQGIQNNQLVLSGKVLADIFMDKVTHWNDPEITALNPGVTLPNALIITVHRADGSGTTYNFSSYLSAVSPSWKSQVGANTVVAWPGFGLGAKGNAGVASQVQNMPNSIGYVEYAYAIQNHMVTTKMQNQAGDIITASSNSFAAAAKNADWAHTPGFGVSLVNQPGAASWPIVATTFALVPNQHSPYAKNSQAVVKFFDWSFKNGQVAAVKLDYIPLPKSAYQLIENQWNAQLPAWSK